MKKETYVDSFLEKKLTKYDEWLDKGQISFSSKVIPVGESFKAKQWGNANRTSYGTASRYKIYSP